MLEALGAASTLLRGARVSTTTVPGTPRALPRERAGRRAGGRMPGPSTDPDDALDAALRSGWLRGRAAHRGGLAVPGRARPRPPAARRGAGDPPSAGPSPRTRGDPGTGPMTQAPALGSSRSGADVRLGQPHVRDGHPQRDARFVQRRRAAGRTPDPLAAAVAQARRMADEGADLLDVGRRVDPTRPRAGRRRRTSCARVVPVVRAVRAALPEMPLSIDTSKPAVAEAALDAGADLLNDVRGVLAQRRRWRASPAARCVPYVVMHDRAEPRYRDVVAEVVGRPCCRRRARGRRGLRARRRSSSIRASASARRRSRTWRCCATWARCGRWAARSSWARAASRPSGGCSTCRADQRLEGTLATTALGDRRAASTSCASTTCAANVRAARMADAIVRGWHDRPDPRQDAQAP